MPINKINMNHNHIPNNKLLKICGQLFFFLHLRRQFVNSSKRKSYSIISSFNTSSPALSKFFTFFTYGNVYLEKTENE